MEKPKKARGPLRQSLTKTLNEAEAELAVAEPDEGKLQLKSDKMDRLMKEIRELDRKILDALLDSDCTEEEYAQENIGIEGYEDRHCEVKWKVHKILSKSIPISPALSEISTAASSTQKKKNFKLPKIEIQKFSGDLKDWLGFWSQFEKIHEDEQIDTSDKFQYLLQAMVKGTRPKDLVESYPPTSENYPKVIEALKNRFGKEELLIEVYVRELLKLVINNASSTRENFVLSRMYDKLETHLRALESLGVTFEKYAAILYPMVESSLPESILVAWQRDSLSSKDGSKEEPPKSRLSFLMEFLKQEVEGEERIALARSGFGLVSTKFKNKPTREVLHDNSYPTAIGLFSGEKDMKQVRCVFCEKMHASEDCFKAPSMTLLEKKSKLRAKKSCFVCFRPNHMAKECKAVVKCQKCNRKHNVLMCPEQLCYKEKYQGTSNNEQTVTNSSMTSQTCIGDILLQTLVIRLRGLWGQEKLVRALIDSGSQRSYVLTETAREMGFQPIGEQTLIHSLFGGATSAEQRQSKYRMDVEHLNGTAIFCLEAFGQENICRDIPRLGHGSWIAEMEKRGIKLSDCGPGCPKIEILLGADVCGRLLTGEIHQLGINLTAIETVLGWTLVGESPQKRTESPIAMMVTSMLSKDVSVADLWKLEAIGIGDPVESKSKGEADESARIHFLNTVTREESGRYQVSLPWVDERKRIPDNRDIAVKRLYSVSNKLYASGRMQDYQEVWEEWLLEGIIEEVPSEEYDKPCHYLPHRPVFKEGSTTTKVRPVFDASCKGLRTPSLNDCLTKGPNMLEMLPTILMRFREKRFGVSADIRKAFLMIKIKEEDQDYLRFLWWENYENKLLKVFRHKRVVFGVNCSPFLLAAVIDYHLTNVPEDLQAYSDKLKKSLYVDNCVTSVDTKEELQSFIEHSTKIMAEAKFDLRMWEHSEVAEKEQPESAILGLKWNRMRDTLSCDIQVLEPVAVNTKRGILSAAQRIFDPLGFLSPVTLCPKLLLQEAWSRKLNWDEQLPPEILKRFQAWVKELPILSHIEIPRRTAYGNQVNWSVHTFCDASKLAYAAVVFLRCETGKDVHVQMLASRARVAPLKKATIPRLELLACTVGSRLLSTVREGLGLEGIPVYFWSDSTTALAWILRNNEWGTFVGNRVKEICSLTRESEWRYVPGLQNPADLPSRGCSATQLLKSKWWEGPAWLQLSKNLWPENEGEWDEDAILSEKKKSSVVSMAACDMPTPWFMKYSNKYTRIVRTVAWIRRFLRNARGKDNSAVFGELTCEETEGAEKNIIRLVQAETCEDSSFAQGLNVQKDAEGILRVKTKITLREDSYDFRHPALLTPRHPFVKALLREEHEKNCHAGPQFLLTQLRERFWIPQSRRVVKSVINECVKCRRHNVKKLHVDPAPLPEDRVKTAAVFEVIGVDLAGPLYLKDRSKVWVVLYTCAVYRAVHLETVSSLSTECFLQSLRRFVARRGRPKIVYSDNGTNFVGSENLFKELHWEEIARQCAVERIHWKFNPPTAAWWGGWWERLVRIMKDLLVRVLGKTCLNSEELLTLLCEVEAVMNGRPLTYVSEDQDDLIPLTPAMFLREIREDRMPDVDLLDQSGFQRRYRYRQRIREDLRTRFRKEYLGLLVQRDKERKEVKCLKVGDVVLVGADNKKRLLWPMAKIVKLIPGKDGAVRVAEVKTATGTFVRPVQRLFPLEVSSEEKEYLKLQAGDKPDLPLVKRAASPQDVCTRYGRKSRVPERLSYV